AAGAPAAEPEAPPPAEPEAPAAKPKLGGTLFERMSNVTRGAQRDEAERDPLDIPRFLHRQNNQ
ncbi:MAG: cell division protein FtsZ, partial [Sphingomonas sp.]|nr:cell division protein FtsZ [Sphingomonas sp.]